MFSTQARPKGGLECAEPAAQPAQCNPKIVERIIAGGRVVTERVGRFVKCLRCVFSPGEKRKAISRIPLSDDSLRVEVSTSFEPWVTCA